MEMKLDERALKFLSDVANAEVKQVFTSCMKHECLDAQITNLLDQYRKEAELLPLNKLNCFMFIQSQACVYEDGRSCPGEERKARLMKLNNGEWRKNHQTIVSGIMFRVITLDANDAIKLS
jgi:hypothetical protein